MDWTAGYASDIEYTAGFYREQSPTFLNFACVLNGYEPIPLDQPFTYFELGFGRGLTANLLAASNPIGEFYAADFNPAHVAGAQQLANAAQLKNLRLLENSLLISPRDSSLTCPNLTSSPYTVSIPGSLQKTDNISFASLAVISNQAELST